LLFRGIETYSIILLKYYYYEIQFYWNRSTYKIPLTGHGNIDYYHIEILCSYIIYSCTGDWVFIVFNFAGYYSVVSLQYSGVVLCTIELELGNLLQLLGFIW